METEIELAQEPENWKAERRNFTNRQAENGLLRGNTLFHPFVQRPGAKATVVALVEAMGQDGHGSHIGAIAQPQG